MIVLFCLEPISLFETMVTRPTRSCIYTHQACGFHRAILWRPTRGNLAFER